MEAVYDKNNKVLIIEDNTIMLEMSIVQAQKIVKELNIIVNRIANNK